MLLGEDVSVFVRRHGPFRLARQGDLQPGETHPDGHPGGGRYRCLRPRIHYKVDDHWSVEVGGNVFLEDTQHTFFGQFEKNSNVYAAVRHGF